MFGRPHTIIAVLAYDPYETDFSDPIYDDDFAGMYSPFDIPFLDE